jgi:hypothetical protein
VFSTVRTWQSTLRTRLDVTISLLLLPLFFSLTGMKTRLYVLSDGRIWLWTALFCCWPLRAKREEPSLPRVGQGIFAIDPIRIQDVKVDSTYLGGTLIYQRQEAAPQPQSPRR